jgi:hypothetical protein
MFSMSRLAKSAVVAAALALGMAGCASERHEGVPASATLGAESRGALTYTAPHDGMVYVVDTNDDRLIYSGAVHRGDVMRLDTQSRRIMLDDRPMQDKVLDTNHTYRVYFDDQGYESRSRTEVRRETVTEHRHDGDVDVHVDHD